MIVIILLLCIFIALYFYHHFYYGRKAQLINSIPGPPFVPFFGNILDYNGSLEHIWKVRRKISADYYPISKIWFMGIPVVNIVHPDDIEKILSSTKHIEKSRIYEFLHPWLGTGLLTSTGKKWIERRKMLTFAFHFNILRQFVNIFIQEGCRMTKTLKDSKDQTVNNLLSFISGHTLNSICETAMGISLENMGTSQNQYRQAIYDIADIITDRVLKPWFNIAILFSFTPQGKRYSEKLKLLHGFTNKIIEERKRYHEDTNDQYLKNFENVTSTDINNIEITGTRKRRLAMLDFLIAASRENQIDDTGIREEVDTFTFEGHDTVAIAILFALLLLAEHEDIQDRARNEINAVLEENGGQFTLSVLQNLPYLERCLKESLRMYPSVPFISRVLAEDTILSSYTVPKGAIVDLHIFDTHRDPNFWPNPNVFDPDRFLPEKIQNRHPYSYIAFSGGPRNCIGQRFAMFEFKAIIASLLHSFYLKPVDYLKNVRIRNDFVTRPAHPIRLQFIPIQ